MLMRFAVAKKHALNFKYVIAFALYALLLGVGALINHLPLGTLIIGLRAHMKHIPLFFLPFIYRFSPLDIKKQFYLILVLMIIQVPISIYQRVVQFGWERSGDLITGTVLISGTLSILLLCYITVFYAFFLKEKVGKFVFLLVSVFLFLPTTINETKVTLVLLPMNIAIITILFKQKLGRKIKTIAVSVLATLIVFMIFVPIYAVFIQPVTGHKLFDFFTSDQVERYLYKGVEGKSHEDVRRLDSLAIAFRKLSTEPLVAIHGIGPGNVMESYFQGLEGRFGEISHLKPTGILLTHLFWELGFLGPIWLLVTLAMIFWDATRLRNRNDVFGTLALGWTAIVMTYTVCIVYTNIILFNSMNFLFWFFSGVVCAEASRARNEARVDRKLSA
jgi:hypothetical protein